MKSLWEVEYIYIIMYMSISETSVLSTQSVCALDSHNRYYFSEQY